MFTKVEAYTLDLILDDVSEDHIVYSPITNIDILHSDVQAYYTELILKSSVITAGETHTWQIEAQDFYENVVVGTDELFGF
jgi:hypothetical protein